LCVSALREPGASKPEPKSKTRSAHKHLLCAVGAVDEKNSRNRRARVPGLPPRPWRCSRSACSRWNWNPASHTEWRRRIPPLQMRAPRFYPTAQVHLRCFERNASRAAGRDRQRCGSLEDPMSTRVRTCSGFRRMNASRFGTIHGFHARLGNPPSPGFDPKSLRCQLPHRPSVPAAGFA